MSRQDQHLKLADVKIQASLRKRGMVSPKVDVRASTPADRQTVVEVVRRVIADHRDVLIALKDR